MGGGGIAQRLALAIQGIGAPVDYSMRTGYRRPPSLYRHLQWLGVLITSAGLGPGYAITLEVVGRRTHKARRTVLVRTVHENAGYLVALSGESEWVRNVRAAGGRAVVRHGRARLVNLVELPVDRRAPVIAQYLRRGGRLAAPEREARYYFGLGPRPTLEEIQSIARFYPVFRIVEAV